MKLKHLVGEFKLSGICLVDLVDKNNPEHQKVYFTLNNITYCVVEDPNDGYRSFMDDISVSTDSISMTTFPPITVTCTHLNEIVEKTSTTIMANILIISDKANNLPILRVGTENTDDYYPYSICEYTPQNMAYNILIGKSLYG